MEKTKAQILDALRRNCKKGYKELSDEIGLSQYLLTPRCKEIERDIRCVSLIDFSKVDYPLHFGIYINSKNTEQMTRFILRNPFINNAFRLKGDFNFYIEIVLKNMKMLEKFLDKLNLQSVDKREVVYIAREEKREGFIFFET